MQLSQIDYVCKRGPWESNRFDLLPVRSALWFYLIGSRESHSRKVLWCLCLTNAFIDLDIKRTACLIHRHHLSLGNDQTLEKAARSLFCSDLFLIAVIIG